MPLLAKIRNFLRSPQGRRLTDSGRRMAADPRNRTRARGFLTRLRRRCASLRANHPELSELASEPSGVWSAFTLPLFRSG
ncbi:MAG: hypothetical protein ACR2GH_23310 [Pseudonocardia sp.]